VGFVVVRMMRGHGGSSREEMKRGKKSAKTMKACIDMEACIDDLGFRFCDHRMTERALKVGMGLVYM